MTITVYKDFAHDDDDDKNYDDAGCLGLVVAQWQELTDDPLTSHMCAPPPPFQPPSVNDEDDN